MAALSITAANVAYVQGSTQIVTYGETVTQGQPIREHTDGKFYLCNNTTSTDAGATKIALTPGSADEKGVAMGGGVNSDIKIGATVAAGTSYYVGGSDGDIVPHGDLSSGDHIVVIGHGISTTTIRLTFNNLGATIA